MNIFDSKVVKQELARLNSVVCADEGRDVQYDISVLTTALSKINNDLLNEGNDFTIVDCNMWEECHISFDRIINALGLKYDDANSNYDYYEFAISR